MEPKIRSVKFNFIMNMVMTGSSILFPLITYPYISNVLLVDRNGQLSFAVSVLTYFGMFASLGIPTYGIRICAQVRNDKEELSQTVQELLLINAISTGLTYAAFFVSLAAVPVFREEKTLLLINSLSLILNTIGVNWFYSALEQYRYITVRSLIFKSLSVVFMFLLVHQESDYWIYAIITVMATGGSNILNFLNLRKFITFRRIRKYDLKRHLKPAFLFFGAAVASSVYTNLDIVMLRFLTNETQVGYYQMASKVKMLITTIITSLGVVLMPRLSYYVQQGRDEDFRRMIIKTFNYVLVFASSLMVFFIIFAKETILVLSNTNFLPAVTPLRILMPSVLLIGFSFVTGLQILIPQMKENQMMVSYVLASVVDFAANLLITPYLKASGAALSTSLAEFTVLLTQIIFLVPFLRTLRGTLSFGKVGSALIIASSLSWSFYHFILIPRGISSLLTLIISACLFFGSGFVLLSIMKEPFVTNTIWPLINKFAFRKKNIDN